MGFSIAIVGGFGVGKSTLCQSFCSLGIQALDFNKIVQGVLDSGDFIQDNALLKQMLTKTYFESGEIPSHVLLDPAFISEVGMYLADASRQFQGSHIFEVPYFFPPALLKVGGLNYDFIIYVMRDEVSQYGALLETYQAEGVAKRLLQKSVHDEAWVAFATDIFMNAVSVEKIKWACSKLLRSYEAQSCVG